MQFSVIAAAAFAAVASAAPATSQTTQMFEFQSFAASCSATSTDCTYSFSLNGATACTGTQPAQLLGSDKKLPSIGSTTCGDTTWSVNRLNDGQVQVSAKVLGANGISGSTNLPATDFGVVDGIEKYTGTGIVILYGIAQ